MDSIDEEREYWRKFRLDLAEKLEQLEVKLLLANPKNMSDDEHDFLIKKLSMFRETILQIDEKLVELDENRDKL